MIQDSGYSRHSEIFPLGQNQLYNAVYNSTILSFFFEVDKLEDTIATNLGGWNKSPERQRSIFP